MVVELKTETTYFESVGSENTDEALNIAIKKAKELRIKKVLVASTTGATGVKAVERFRNTGIEIIVVTHQYGRRAPPGKTALKRENMEKMKAVGVKICGGTDPISGAGRTFRKYGDSPFDIVADTLRMVGRGFKVAVEIAIKSCDVGLVSPNEEVIAVAGTHSGADTVVVLQPSETPRLFRTKIKEIVAKPRERAPIVEVFQHYLESGTSLRLSKKV